MKPKSKHEEKEKLARQYKKELNELWSKRELDFKELDKPYQDGYVFCLALKENMSSQLTSEEYKILKKWESYLSKSYYSHDKVPKALLGYDPLIDVYVEKEKYGKGYNKKRLFADFYVRKNETIGGFTKEEFNEVKPFMEYGYFERKTWWGAVEKNWFYTLQHKYRRFFYLRRYKKMITHHSVKNGEIESRINYIWKKLYETDKLAYKYLNNYHERWDSNVKEKYEKYEKILDQEAEKEAIDLLIGERD